jgi:uridine kinase
MVQGTRDELLGHIAEAVASLSLPRPTRVAIDGPPAAGKTTLADELGVVLRGRGRAVIRAGIDDFLVPRAQRYRRGEYSATGCYLDAHDHPALNRVLLDPLGPGGARHFQVSVYDSEGDTTSSPSIETAADDAVLPQPPTPTSPCRSS